MPLRSKWDITRLDFYVLHRNYTHIAPRIAPVSRIRVSKRPLKSGVDGLSGAAGVGLTTNSGGRECWDEKGSQLTAKPAKR